MRPQIMIAIVWALGMPFLATSFTTNYYLGSKLTPMTGVSVKRATPTHAHVTTLLMLPLKRDVKLWSSTVGA